MSCALEFSESLVKIDFCSKGNKQKILINVLTKYSEMDIDRLASVLEVPVRKLNDICEGDSFLVWKAGGLSSPLIFDIFWKTFFSQMYFNSRL